ncbi:hypothetical protein C7999DRAFT_16346 [Corynascus novoguineensis]|uniref:Uncharacterized protein n=1 Tax=Corynascus novoguineensis TaxID=1126955 RepID=A0AAN7HMT8_9PEZI|nr:hypothetical protein C7999DRAFT_16346 [Corynascus novoguineensis]
MLRKLFSFRSVEGCTNTYVGSCGCCHALRGGCNVACGGHLVRGRERKSPRSLGNGRKYCFAWIVLIRLCGRRIEDGDAEAPTEQHDAFGKRTMRFRNLFNRSDRGTGDRDMAVVADVPLHSTLVGNEKYRRLRFSKKQKMSGDKVYQVSALQVPRAPTIAYHYPIWEPQALSSHQTVVEPRITIGQGLICADLLHCQSQASFGVATVERDSQLSSTVGPIRQGAGIGVREPSVLEGTRIQQAEYIPQNDSDINKEGQLVTLLARVRIHLLVNHQ